MNSGGNASPGRPGHLTFEQEAKLHQFRQAVQDILTRPDHDDRFLLRWLKARNFNVDAAESMLRKNQHWRKWMELDKRPLDETKYPEVLRKYTFGSIAGHDKEGCPIWIFPFGSLDMKGLCYSATKTEIILGYVGMHFELTLDDMKTQSKKLGRVVDKLIAIFDYGGMTWEQVAGSTLPLQMAIVLLKTYQDNYPEILKRAFVTNAPKFTPYIYALLHPFMTEEVINKVKFYSYQDMSWKDELLEMCDPSELPKHWGGTKVDPDGNPKCPSLIRFGKPVPRKYYGKEYRMLCCPSDPNLKTETVRRRSTHKVELSVTEAKTVIHWEFKTEDHDIAFGVFRRLKDYEVRNGLPTEQNEVEIIPLHKVNSHIVPEDGTLVCDIPGLYILKFDNSYSYYRTKKIMYSTRMVNPSNSSLN